MAYYSNGSEGGGFERQCGMCKYGDKPCPIALIQITYNYDQARDETGTARAIMDTLVAQNGTCSVFEMAKQDFFRDPNQLKLFP